MKPTIKATLTCLLSVALLGGMPETTAQVAPARKEVHQPPVRTTQPVPVTPDREVASPPGPEKLAPAVVPMTMDMERLNEVISVSGVYTRTLSDAQIYIDERGSDGMVFDLARLEDGTFALAYSASSENLSIRNKGVLFRLNQDFTQRGAGVIFTQYQEDLLDLQVERLQPGTTGIAFTCHDLRGPDRQESSDRETRELNLILARDDGGLESRLLEETRGPLNLVGFRTVPYGSDITLAYNADGSGKLGLTGMQGSYVSRCRLLELPVRQADYRGKDIPRVRPQILDWTVVEGKFLLLSGTRLTAPFWNFAEHGLASGIGFRPAWPLLLTDGFAVSDNYGKDCPYDNDPYTPMPQPMPAPEALRNIVALDDGGLGLLSEQADGWRFYACDDHLQPVGEGVFLHRDIRPGDVLLETPAPGYVLLLYALHRGTVTEYRAVIWAWQTGQVILDGSQVLWSEPYYEWGKFWKLVPLGPGRYAAVSLAVEDGHYAHTQGLEYRIISLNLPSE